MIATIQISMSIPPDTSTEEIGEMVANDLADMLQNSKTLRFTLTDDDGFGEVFIEHPIN